MIPCCKTRHEYNIEIERDTEREKVEVSKRDRLEVAAHNNNMRTTNNNNLVVQMRCDVADEQTYRRLSPLGRNTSETELGRAKREFVNAIRGRQKNSRTFERRSW